MKYVKVAGKKKRPRKKIEMTMSSRSRFSTWHHPVEQASRRMINAFMQHFLLLILDWILRQLLCDGLRKDVLFTIPPDLNATYLFIKPFGRLPLLQTTALLVFWKHSKIHLNAETIICSFLASKILYWDVQNCLMSENKFARYRIPEWCVMKRKSFWNSIDIQIDLNNIKIYR